MFFNVHNIDYNRYSILTFFHLFVYFQKRGYIPPESNATTILKNTENQFKEDTLKSVDKPSDSISKVIDTALDKKFDTKNVSCNHDK